MADNYIEKQYEQYQSRKAAWEKIHKRTSAKNTTLQGVQATLSNDKASQQNGKRVFVTGGAKGIGCAIVKAFCREGYRVAFCDVDEVAGMQTAEETGAMFYQVDISDGVALEQCMNHLLDEWKDIDVIVNNAGISKFSSITQTTIEEFDHILDVNLRPVFITSRVLAIRRRLRGMINHYGRIINISSTRSFMSEPGSEAYAASKGGINSITHALAISLADFHITVNSIAPGWIQTDDYDCLSPEDHAQHPSKRVGKPEDIARICLFLCREENDFINGENITVDGGMTKKMIYTE